LTATLETITNKIHTAEKVATSDVATLMKTVDADRAAAYRFARDLWVRHQRLYSEAQSIARIARAIEAHIALFSAADVEF